MRHRQSGRKLNRNSAHRTAMFRNMTASLVRHELIKTTLVKAKELRSVAEPVITLAKRDSVANRRLAFSRTRSRVAVAKLFSILGPRYADRPGGYIRILKCAPRAGDNAPMAYVELVDRPGSGPRDYDEAVDGEAIAAPQDTQDTQDEQDAQDEQDVKPAKEKDTEESKDTKPAKTDKKDQSD